MIILMLLLWSVAEPVDGRMNGVYCDEVVGAIMEYQEETGAFSESQLDDLLDGCDRYEESDVFEEHQGVVDEVSK